jgi:hypothetical protein
MHPRSTQALLKWISFICAASIVMACGPSDAEGDGGGKVFDPQLPASTFVSETDAEKREKLMQQMWSALIAPACWDASFIGPATPGGSVGSVSQFTFSGEYRYRYVGYETHVGGVTLIDIGRYRGKPAALLATWSGETEGLILVDNKHFEHVLTAPSGGSYAVTFWTSGGPCL